MTTLSRCGLPPSVLRVLLCIYDMRHRGEPPTLRAIQKRLNLKAMNYVAVCVKQLRDGGLVTWDKDKAATLQPTRQLVIYVPEYKAEKPL